MPADFPDSPTVGDTFLVGGILRKWDGVTWSIIPQTIPGPSGSIGPTGPTGPAGPAQGDFTSFLLMGA